MRLRSSDKSNLVHVGWGESLVTVHFLMQVQDTYILMTNCWVRSALSSYSDTLLQRYGYVMKPYKLPFSIVIIKNSPFRTETTELVRVCKSCSLYTICLQKCLTFQKSPVRSFDLRHEVSFKKLDASLLYAYMHPAIKKQHWSWLSQHSVAPWIKIYISQCLKQYKSLIKSKQKEILGSPAKYATVTLNVSSCPNP
jgi:hypothetical protein